MSDLVLYGESSWVSPWVFHAMTALEEKGLAYELRLPPLPLDEATRSQLRDRTVFGKVPVLVHGEAWIGDSLAISEYVAETFPSTQGFPRLFPADLAMRARARGVMQLVRISFAALREERPTDSVFGANAGEKAGVPMSPRARADADEVIRIASALVGDRTTIGDAWCIADADLALACMRLVANGDAVPPAVERYARTVWERPSLQNYIGLARANR
ncbi:MAG TPA: glutathione transferase [Kofleriaceae bacterium]|jgi:glutathione S-transferase|nr:glutathione transferase [Kofleriaceae bacterium]